MRDVLWTDEMGRKFLMRIPDGAPDDHAPMGVHVGPPYLDALKLPVEVEVRLNNQLYDRGLFTWREVRQRRDELLATWQAVLRVDVGLLFDLYTSEGGN